MKFSLASVFALAISASTATAATIHKRQVELPSTFTLSASTDGLSNVIWNTLMYGNSSAYIGNFKYTSNSELLELTSGGTFTSFHSAPTGWQNIYIFPNASAPIGFTIPHSGAIPTGAITTGLGQSANGTFTWGGEEKWRACNTVAEGTYQIFWDGEGQLSDCADVKLTVTERNC